MNDVRLERLLDDVLAGIATEHVPDLLGHDIASTTSRVRQRPRWLALIKEPPMRLPSGLAVGSPTLRLASLMALTIALILALGAAVVAGASLLRADLPAPFGLARNGALAYSDGGDIWIADESGANGTPIVTGPGDDLSPWYSHDGTGLAFTRLEADGTSTLMVARADGSADPISLVADYVYADWSPDDTQLAVQHIVDGQNVISVVAADGTGVPRRLDIGGIRLRWWGPWWRPEDGAELVVLGQTPGTADLGLHAISPDGNHLRIIGELSTAYNAWELSFQNPTLSPDGRFIGYTNWEPNDVGKTDAWGHLRDLSTGADQRIDAYAQPHFSPDGVTVVGEKTGEDALVIGPLDGSAPLRTIQHGWTGNANRVFEISPDGKQAWYSVGEPRRTWIIDLASGTSAETSQLIPDVPNWQRLIP